MKLTQKTMMALVAMSLAGGMWVTPTLAKGMHHGPDFATLDADNDGFLTKAEMIAHVQNRFAKMDSNGDGALTKEEMISAAKARAADRGKEFKEERMSKRLNKMFDRHDANSDGKLTQDELPKKRMDKMFSKLDTDKDGRISKAEFDAHKAKRKSKS